MIKSTEKPLGFTRFGHVGNQIQIYCVIDVLFEISRKIWSSMQINKNSNVLIYISKLRITIPMLIVAATSILSYYFYLNNMLQISSEIVILNTNVALLVIVISFIIKPPPPSPPSPPPPKKKDPKKKSKQDNIKQTKK